MRWASQVKMIAFDIDGTLFSSESIILDVYIRAIHEFRERTGNQLQVPTREEIMFQVGRPVKEIFQNLLPGISEKERDEVSNRVLDLLCDSVRTGGGNYYGGVGSTIHYLREKGYLLTSASNGRKPYVETVLDTAGVLSFFEPLVVVGMQDITTKVGILREYIRKYNLSPDSIAMIGDRHSDWEAARQNGCFFLFCEYGHAPPGEIPDFDWKLSSLEQMKEIF